MGVRPSDASSILHMQHTQCLPHPTLFEFDTLQSVGRIYPDSVSLLFLPESEEGWRGRLVCVSGAPVGTLRYRLSSRAMVGDDPLAASDSEFHFHGEFESLEALRYVPRPLDSEGYPLDGKDWDNWPPDRSEKPMSVGELIEFWLKHRLRIVESIHDIVTSARDKFYCPSEIKSESNAEIVAQRMLGAWIGSAAVAQACRQLSKWQIPDTWDILAFGLSRPTVLTQPTDGLTPLLLLAQVERDRQRVLSRFGVDAPLAAHLCKLSPDITLRLMRWAGFPDAARCGQFFNRLLPLMKAWWRTAAEHNDHSLDRFQVASALMGLAFRLLDSAAEEGDLVEVQEALDWLDWIERKCWDLDPDDEVVLPQLGGAPVELSVPVELLISAIEQAVFHIASSPEKPNPLRISRRWLFRRAEWRNHRLLLRYRREFGVFLETFSLEEVLSGDFASTVLALRWPCCLEYEHTAWQAFSAQELFNNKELTVVSLNTVHLVSEEGREMNHCCGARMSSIAMSGQLRLFSIRCSGERVATLSLRWDEATAAWKVEECRGKSNACIGLEHSSALHELSRLVGAVLDFYNAPQRAKPYAPVALKANRPMQKHRTRHDDWG